MDTRTKIISTEDAVRLAAEGSVVVSGYFDPLVADLVDRLQSLKQPDKLLLVAISTPDDVILPARARQELVAALACVDHVTEMSSDLVPQIRLEDEHTVARQRLVAHVHQRQQAAS
jgi:hypothetical protein